MARQTNTHDPNLSARDFERAYRDYQAASVKEIEAWPDQFEAIQAILEQAYWLGVAETEVKYAPIDLQSSDGFEEIEEHTEKLFNGDAADFLVAKLNLPTEGKRRGR